jgi:ribosomal protein S18 acetylase RimI-like enzyme
MVTTLEQPETARLPEVLATLAGWQDDAAPFQLHPGDLGWSWRSGAAALAPKVRVWRRGERIVALGEVDDAAIIRLAIDPDLQDDAELARALADDLGDPGRGVLGAGSVSVEVAPGAALRDELAARGWVDDERWTPLRRRLDIPVEDPAVRIEVVGPDRVAEMLADRVAVQRASFATSVFTEEQWHVMAGGPAYRDARCLVGYDDAGAAVAAATVWSAGPGRPGLIEPLGTHRDHRGHGHGRAITVASARVLQDLGASSATVCTPSANTGGVATYISAGYEPWPERLDLRRPSEEGAARGV